MPFVEQPIEPCPAPARCQIETGPNGLEARIYLTEPQFAQLGGFDEHNLPAADTRSRGDVRLTKPGPDSQGTVDTGELAMRHTGENDRWGFTRGYPSLTVTVSRTEGTQGDFFDRG